MHDQSDLILHLNITAENEYDADPALINEVAFNLVTSLDDGGYLVQPVPGGEKGGMLFDVLMFGGFIITNKDLFIELLKTIQPVLQYALRVRERKADEEGPVKFSLTLDGASIAIEAPDVESVERLMVLAKKFRIANPTVAAQVNPQSSVTLTARVPKRVARKRR